MAHCSSCEPERSAEQMVKLELDRATSRKACLEAELLGLELERRRLLAKGSDAVPLDISTWSLAMDSSAKEIPSTIDD